MDKTDPAVQLLSINAVRDIMYLKKIEKPKTYDGLCPECPEGKNNVTYIHDLRCPICDNETIVFCPNCKNHWEVQGE